MKNIVFMAFISLVSFHSLSQGITKIHSKLGDKESEIYQSSIVGYQRDPYWSIWSDCPGEPFASSILMPQGLNTYYASNICDFDLNTAWVASNNESGIGEKFGFTLRFPDESKFGEVYQFFGVFNVFNGYCKSLKTWTDNARLKTLKLFLNDNPVCLVELIDTWHFQQFDVREFFTHDQDSKLNEWVFEIREGDLLTFEIIEVYRGAKYRDVAVSVFMVQLAGN